MHYEPYPYELLSDPLFQKFKTFLKSKIENLIKVKVVEECILENSTDLNPLLADIHFVMNNTSELVRVLFWRKSLVDSKQRQMVEDFDREILWDLSLHRDKIKPISAYLIFNSQEGKERFLALGQKVKIFEEEWKIHPGEDPVHINWENLTRGRVWNIRIGIILGGFHVGVLWLFGYVYWVIS